MVPTAPTISSPAELNVAAGQVAVSSDAQGKQTRLSTCLVGISLYNGIFWLYDYAFFPFVIWKLGLVAGAVLLTFTTALVDYWTLRFYNSSQEDWLALEYLKNLKDYEGRNVFKKAFGWTLKNTPPLVQIILLTPKSNAFITTALLRQGAYTFRSMTTRDWKIFWTSFFCSQAYWIGLVWLGVEGLGSAFKLLFN